MRRKESGGLTMKIHGCLFLAALLCLTSVYARAPEQRIVLDDSHAMHIGDESAQPFIVSPTEVLIIDASTHKFELPPGIEAPNAIHVVIGSDRYYRVPWTPGTRVYRVDKGTAQPLSGSRPLKAFRSGQTVTFAIGRDNYESITNGDLQFVVIWAGMVRVE
jgi:hypothetical protein